MNNEEKEVKKNSPFDISGIISLIPSLLGFSLLLTFGITGNIDYLIYSTYISIMILTLTAYLFFMLGLELGFYVHLEGDAEIDFSLLLIYYIYLTFNLTLCVIHLAYN